MRLLFTVSLALVATGCVCGSNAYIGHRDAGTGGSGFFGGGTGTGGGQAGGTQSTGGGAASTGGGATSTGGGSSATGGGGSSATGGGTATGGGAGPCGFTCADDLHTMIDCHGATSQCGAGLGCTPQGCIDSCQAASVQGTAIGCDFYAAPVASQPQTVGSCYAVFLANTWNAPISITVTRAGTSFDAAQFTRIPTSTGTTTTYDPLPLINGKSMLPAGKMAILFLAQVTSGVMHFVGCPAGIPVAFASPFQLNGTGLTSSFHITTTAPVVAYDMYPYGGAISYVSSASLLIPTSAWGTNYVGVDPIGEFVGNGQPYLQLLGETNNTSIAIQAAAAIQGGTGVPGSGPSVIAHYTLNQGDVLQLEQSAELSGALIKSDKPIAVWGGHSCMQVPIGVVACDSAHQQLPPVQLLGNDLVAVRHKERKPGANEPAIWRFVGVVAGTTLSYDPPMPGAPTTLEAGQTADFSSPGPFRVQSQDLNHVFYLAQLMTGQLSNGVGDPDFVNVVPPLQYLKSYLFFTDTTYDNTDLVFVRSRGPDSVFHDVTLDCLGTVSGWVDIGTSGFQYARASWSLGASTGCANGVHTATSTVPFGLTVWGTAFAASYGYVAGMRVQPINSVDAGPEIN